MDADEESDSNQNFYLKPHWIHQHGLLSIYSIITPLKYHAFENIMENGAFALLGQMLYFSIIFSMVFKT